MMNSKVNNVPKLRFKEFSGEWFRESLKNLTTINQGLQIPISERYEKYVDESHFYITNEFLRKDSKKAYYIKSPPETVLCDYNDILMTRTGNTGQVVTNVKGAFHNNFFKIKFDKNLLLKDFLVYFLTHYKTQQLILKLAGTSTIPDLNHGDFYKIVCLLPSLEEQQKIAEFLSSVDSKLQALKQKQQLLQQYKKGMMQKLFSQQIRFKDENGQDYQEWEKYKFNELYNFVKTNSLSRESLTYEFGSIKNIHYGDIHTKYKSHFDIKKENAPYLKSNVNLNKISNDEFCKPCDLIIADASEDYKDIGKTIEIINVDNESLISGLHTFIARPIENKISIGFGGFLMQSEQIRKQIQKLATGISVLGISKNNIIKVTYDLPSIPEQQKIANFLSAIDQKIEGVTKQIEQTALFKKGLLQQLFV